MRTKIRHFHVIFGLAFLGAALLLWVWPKKQQASPIQQQTVVVRVDRVKETTTQRTIRFSGITRAVRRATVAFSVPGRLVRRSVEVGDRVQSGLELAGIDVREYRNSVNMTRAVVAELTVRASQAERDRQRIRRLADAHAATKEELEQITAAVDAVNASLSAATAQLDEAMRVLGEATLKAPFPGTVTAVFLEPGEYAAPGRPVVELSGEGEIELQVEVPENLVANLREGESVRAVLPMAGGKQLAGRVKSVARAAVGPGRLFPVVAVLEPGAGLSAGMTAELILDVKSEGALTVPVSAVLNPGSSNPYVFCMDGKIVRKVAVVPGAFSGDRIVVRGDLSAADRVIVSGHTMLAGGEKVEVAS